MVLLSGGNVAASPNFNGKGKKWASTGLIEQGLVLMAMEDLGGALLGLWATDACSRVFGRQAVVAQASKEAA